MTEPHMPAASVITVTRSRPSLLARAIISVERQTFASRLEHLILVDDCPKTVAVLESMSHSSSRRWIPWQRQSTDRSGPGRSSRLRNAGVRLARGSWIAFIDDDNEWEPDHVETLMSAARAAGVRAANSYRQMLNPDGSPFMEPRSPWARSDDAAIEYERLETLGVVERGSNVRRDRLMHEAVVVDTGEWLLARELLLEVPFRDDFDVEDESALRGEDDKLAADLLAAGVEVACTERPTLKYYLGGYSNNPMARADPLFAWR